MKEVFEALQRLYPDQRLEGFVILAQYESDDPDKVLMRYLTKGLSEGEQNYLLFDYQFEDGWVSVE